MSALVIDEDGNVQTWTAVYWRHQVKHNAECDSFADAFWLLERGEEDGELSSHSILGPDGRVLMDKAQIHKAQLDRLDPEALLVQLGQQRAIAGEPS